LHLRQAIGGSVTGGIGAVHIGSLTVRGSVRAFISAYQSIGRLVVQGSLVDSLVTVNGPMVPDGKRCVGIGSVTVFGRVESSQIVAGYDSLGISENADLQIGAVTVHGDWIASDLVAGIYPGLQTNVYGDGDDQKLTGPVVTDQPRSF
jgi:hypothetical protein